MKLVVTAAVLAFACMGAQAQSGSKVRVFGSVGASFGGDTLASGKYTDGSSFSVKSGDGFLISGGVRFPVANKFDLQASLGYQSSSTFANNGNISFTRTPIEVLGFYRVTENWHLGGGLRSATSAKPSTSGVASVLGSKDFNSSLGVVVEAQYHFRNYDTSNLSYGINMRYISESFEEKVSKAKFNGNSVGLGFFLYY